MSNDKSNLHFTWSVTPSWRVTNFAILGESQNTRTVVYSDDCILSYFFNQSNQENHLLCAKTLLFQKISLREFIIEELFGIAPVNMYTYTYMHMYVHTFIYVYVYAHVCAYIFHIYVYVYVCVHTYI